jgi:large subunit ribosomal protein L3
MTQIFDKAGNIVPVTVISASPCVVTHVMTTEKNGYNAIQVGYGDTKEKSLTKAMLGQFKKRNLTPRRSIREIRAADVSGYQVGQEIKVDVFQPGDYVDVSGVTKGKGYAGGVKRYNFRGGPSTHGQSDRQRAPGSLGAQGFQRVIKGLRMAGHLGHENVTIQRLEIVAVDPQKNLLLIKGAVPGVNKGIVVIEQTVKRIKAKAAEPAAKAEKKKAAPAKGKK